MTKHINTFGELNIGDSIYRYSTNSDQVEQLEIKNIINLCDKTNIYIDNDNPYCVDSNRSYVVRRTKFGIYVLASDYEVKEVIDTVISITKEYMGKQFNKMFNCMFKTNQ